MGYPSSQHAREVSFLHVSISLSGSQAGSLRTILSFNVRQARSWAHSPACSCSRFTVGLGFVRAQFLTFTTFMHEAAHIQGVDGTHRDHPFHCWVDVPVTFPTHF